MKFYSSHFISDRNCKHPYRFHRGDDFYTYEDHLAKSRPVPHQVNTGYFSKRRAKSARPGKRCVSPRPTKAQLYDTDNCEEGRKPSQNQSNSEMSQTQLQQSIVNQSGSMLDSTLNDNHQTSSSATKTASSSKISLAKASSRSVSSSSSSSSSSSESGSPRPNIHLGNQNQPQFIKRM